MFRWTVLVCLFFATLAPLSADGGASVAEVRVNDAQAVAGQAVQGTVVLEQVAPAEGLWVELLATGPAHAPKAVFVPAGQDQAEFTLHTDPVTVDTAVQVHALVKGQGPSHLVVLLASDGVLVQK